MSLLPDFRLDGRCALAPGYVRTDLNADFWPAAPVSACAVVFLCNALANQPTLTGRCFCCAALPAAS